MPSDRLQEKLSKHWEDPDLARSIDLCADEEILGIGNSRLVIAVGSDRVAKLAWKEPGILANEIEWRVWASASESLRNILAPTLSFSPEGVAVQSLCLPVSFEALGDRGKRLVGDLAVHGITDVAVNLGLFEERIVCYDYSQIRSEFFFELFGL